MKKIFAIVLSFMLCLSVVLGCGNNKKQAVNNGSTKVTTQIKVDKNGTYTDKDHVAAYINEFNKLPKNYITKAEAKKLGWQTKGSLDKVAPGKSIGGDRYGDYEGKLPKKSGRSYKECDIDYVKGNRNAKRIIFSNDGLIFYTEDHYKNFKKIYEGKKKL